MSSLIPYAQSELAPTAMDLGVAIGKSLGAAGISTAKKMYAGRKKRQVKKTYSKAFKEVGRQPNYNPARRAIRESGVTSIANKELFDEPLIRIEKNVAGDEQLNKRNRDTINYKGTKICFMLKSTLKLPIFLNWAIVTPRRIDTISSADFLRDGTAERDMAVDANATFLDLRCAPINTDRYNVHMHERHTILPDSDKNAAVQSEGRDLKIIEKYIPLKRQVFFDGDTATPLTNAYMVWWVDFYNSTTGGPTSLTADVSWRMIQYYQDIP